MKKTAKILKLLLVLLILLGIVGGIIRIYEKNRWDEKDRVVSVIMDYTEAEKIVEAFDGQYNLSAFTTTGFSAIMLPSNDGEYDKLTLEQLRAGGLSIGLLPDADFNCEDFVASYLTLGANFPLIIGDDIPAGSDLSYANEAGFTLARYSGVAPTLESNSTVLVHKVSGIMDGDGTEESSQILCNEIVSSVVDEGVRVIYFSALSTSNGTINGDLSAYFSLIRNIDNELNNFGFYIDSALNIEPTPTTDFASLFICLGICALFLLFITGIKHMRSLTGLIIVCSLVLLTILLWLVANSFIVTIMRSLAMLTLPGLSVYLIISRCRILHLSNGNRSVSSVFFYSLGITFVTGVVSIFSAHLAKVIDISVTWNISPLLKIFVWIVTILYSCVVLFRLLYLEKGASPTDYIASIYFSLIKNKARTIAIGLVILTALLLWILVINTSDNSISSILDSLLSKIVAVPPPFSQYMIGYPSISAALVLCSRRMRAGAWPFILLSCIIGVTSMLSVVNAIVPVRHTFVSMMFGLGLGLIVSFIIDLAFSLIIKALKLRQPRGWHLYDDETESF